MFLHSSNTHMVAYNSFAILLQNKIQLVPTDKIQYRRFIFQKQLLIINWDSSSPLSTQKLSFFKSTTKQPSYLQTINVTEFVHKDMLGVPATQADEGPGGVDAGTLQVVLLTCICESSFIFCFWWTRTSWVISITNGLLKERQLQRECLIRSDWPSA